MITSLMKEKIKIFFSVGGHAMVMNVFFSDTENKWTTIKLLNIITDSFLVRFWTSFVEMAQMCLTRLFNFLQEISFATNNCDVASET